jgi:hypothetical protein
VGVAIPEDIRKIGRHFVHQLRRGRLGPAQWYIASEAGDCFRIQLLLNHAREIFDSYHCSA